MDAASPPRAAYHFDRFTLDLARGALLTSGGAELPLRPKSFALLQLLVENAGRLLDRDSIMGAVWPDVFVIDDSISQCVRDIRRALGDESQHLLRTVPRRGYLFDAEVSRAGPAAATLEELPALIEKTSSQAPPAPEPSEPKGPSISSGAERRQLTVLFCDLVGSSALSERLDPEDFSEVIRSYQERCTAIVVSFGGHVAKYLGDGVLAYFGYPHAHEDAAEQAVRAGLAIVGAVADLGARPDLALRARVGIATGLVVSGPAGEGGQGEIAVGRPLNLAARLQEMAEPGAVVIADDTRRLLGEVFALRDLGAVELKGFTHSAHAFEVLAERPSGSRFEARRRGELPPMVGRGQELALMLERWRRAAAGEGQAVLLVGEAGIGKSRLVRATLDAIAGSEHTTLRYQCSPHHTGTPLWPVAQQLGLAAGLEPADGDTTKLDKLEVLLRQGVEDVSEAAPLIAALLGVEAGNRYPAPDLSPQRRRLRTLVVLVEQLLGLARRRPVLLVLEDAHWADPTTLELLGQALDRIADARALMLLTSRPENQPSLGGHSLVTRLTLNRLGRGPTEAIVARLAGGRKLPPGVLGEITTRTDGVPLFVEELTKAVLEAGAAGTGAAVVPASLHASLMARLDRVPGTKEVAQAAACIGRDLAYPLLAAVSPVPEAELRDALERLVAAELVFRRGEPPEASYAFKHALVRDAAYESLLKSSRARLHGRIAAALQERHSLGSEPEVVARHLTLAERYEDATDYWLQAGVRASNRSAYVEAANSLASGLVTVARIGDARTRLEKELRIRSLLASALRATKGHAAVELEDTLRRGLHLATELGSPIEVSHAQNGLSLVHVNRGDLQQARTHAEEALRQADRDGDRPCQVLAHRTMGMVLLLAGEFAPARRELERTAELYRPEQDRTLLQRYSFDPLVAALGFLEWTCWILGCPDTARRHFEGSSEQAERLGHGYSQIYHHTTAAVLHLMLRDPASSRTHAGIVIELSEEQRLPYFASIAKCCDGWARAMAGDGEAGVARVREGLAARQAVPWEPFMLACVAEALLTGGRGDDATACLAEAADLVERTGSRWWEAELHRLRGLCWLSRPTPDADRAEAGFRTALDVARSQEARSWELRAAISLSQLWHDRGKPAQARELLTPIYARFSEGFGTPDLRDAEALLDELQ